MEFEVKLKRTRRTNAVQYLIHFDVFFLFLNFNVFALKHNILNISPSIVTLVLDHNNYKYMKIKISTVYLFSTLAQTFTTKTFGHLEFEEPETLFNTINTWLSVLGFRLKLYHSDFSRFFVTITNLDTAPLTNNFVYNFFIIFL